MMKAQRTLRYYSILELPGQPMKKPPLISQDCTFILSKNSTRILVHSIIEKT